MPAPAILGWCTNSLTSLQRSVHYMITGFTKPEEEGPQASSSPFPSMINQLRGKTPAEKHRYLNYAVQTIAENEADDKNSIDSISMLVRTTAAVQLQLQDLILEGLRSTDASVVRCALKADWYFSGDGYDYVNFKYFKELLSVVSLSTRRAIIKKLSRSLVNHENKAQEFFEGLFYEYGLQEAIPMLNACSDDFIYDQVLKHKINLSIKMLDNLFKRVPNFVVKYLQLGNKNNYANSGERNVHEIIINDYDSFIPKLIKNYPKDFVELYEVTPEKELKLGDSKTGLFMKNLKQDVIDRPRMFLKLLSPEVVCENLTKEQMVTMFENFFPKDINDFSLDEILDLLDHYHHGNKFQLLSDRYSFAYDRQLLDEDILMRSKRLQRIVPIYERKAKARFFARKYEMTDPDLFHLYVSYLPPNESIPILMMRTCAIVSAEERTRIFGHAITSCSVYNSQADLIEVMRMFLKNFKEDPKSVILHRFFVYLKGEHDLSTLDNSHWTVLENIITLAYVKKELVNSHVTLIESILEETLYQLITKQKDGELIDKMFDIIVETKIEESSPTWNICKRDPALEKECLEKFFLLIPMRYPEEHELWQNYDFKLSTALNIVGSIASFNDRNSGPKNRYRPKKHSESGQKPQEPKVPLTLNIKNYPWILTMTDEFFAKTNDKGYRKKKLLSYLKKLVPEVYEEKLDLYEPVRDLDSGEALYLLRKNYKKVLANWNEYLEHARKKLLAGSKGTKRFISAVRWYDDIADRFVERCIYELDNDGSILVLGLLLEGESFESVVAPLIPNELTFNPARKDAKKFYERTRIILQSMRYVNPPVSFDLVNVFCSNDYAHLSAGLMASIMRNIPADRVIKFARNLVNNRSAAVRKQGIRMIAALATKSQLREFLEETWNADKNITVRLIVAKMIFNTFTRAPTTKNWILMKKCISGLTINDRQIIEKLSEIESVNRIYVSPYIEEYLSKIETLSRGNGLDSSFRTKCVCLIVEGIDEKIMNNLSEETSSMILKKYFLDADSIEISQVVQNFAVRLYLLQAGDKLASRLNVIMQILTSIMSNFDKPHPKKPRYRAANYTIYEFFCNALTEMSCSDSYNKMEIIDNMMDIFKTTLAPWQEPWTYISLSLYKEYLTSDSPRNFGTRCANRVPTLIEEFSANDLVVNDIAACMEDFMAHKIFRDFKNPELKLEIIEGILRGDDHYGALLASILLNHAEVESYDEKYDQFIKTLRNQKSQIVLYNYYNHINRIKYYGDEL